MGLRTFTERVEMGVKTLALIQAHKKFNAERDPAALAAAASSAKRALDALAPLMARDEHANMAKTLEPMVEQFKIHSGQADAFMRRDYVAAFDSAYAMVGSARSDVAYAALNCALDALGQVKTEALASVGAQPYQSAYGDTEAELLAAATRAFGARNSFLPSPGQSPSGFRALDGMHGLAMASAYVLFVGGDLAEAARWIQASAARFGVEPILRREIGEPTGQFWFYDNLDKPAMDRFREFLGSTLDIAPAARPGPKP